MTARRWPSGRCGTGGVERTLARDTRTRGSARRRSAGPPGGGDPSTRGSSGARPAMLCLDPCALRRSPADVAENDSSLISLGYGNSARKGNNAFVVAPGALELPDDLAALREEAPGLLSARDEERAEPALMAEAPRADQIPIRDQTPEREREEEDERPAETGGPPDQGRPARPEDRE